MTAIDDGWTVLRHTCEQHQELFVTARAEPGEPIRDTLARLAGTLREHHARPISVELFAAPERLADARAACSELLGEATPAVVVGETVSGRTELAGLTCWAAAGVEVTPIEWDGRVVGHAVGEVDKLYRITDFRPSDVAAPRPEQARSVCHAMHDTLASLGLGFTNVCRTWYYNDDILGWYRQFNQVRDECYGGWQVDRGRLPASTGIGAPSLGGGALVAGLLAADAGVPWAVVESPLQRSAAEYGSTFSRSVQVSWGGLRRLFVSGTASIDLVGNTQHVGDFDAQVGLTMEVVGALLEAGGMSWPEVTRSIVYIARADDTERFFRWCEQHLTSPLPMVVATNTVCRGDLLFEIEVDAIGRRP